MKDLIINLQQTVIAAIDTGRYDDITVADIEAAWEKGKIVDFLRQRLKPTDLLYSAFYMDSPKYDELESVFGEHFAAYLPRASKYSGVVNSGLCCVAGGLAELLRTI